MTQFPMQDPFSGIYGQQPVYNQPLGQPTWADMYQLYQNPGGPVYPVGPQTFGQQLGGFLQRSPVGPFAPLVMMGAAWAMGPEFSQLMTSPPIGEYNPYNYLQHIRTQGSLNPSLFRLNWGRNWTIQDFNLTAGQDAFYNQMQSAVQSIYTIGVGSQLNAEQQLNASRVAAQLTNFSRSNNPLSGQVRQLLRWAGLEDQTFMIGGLNEFYNMMGDETFNRQARRDLYSRLSNVVGSEGRLRGAYGFEETGQLVSDLARYGLMDVTGFTEDERAQMAFQRASRSRGMTMDDYGMNIEQINMFDGMKKTEVDRLGNLIEEQLENFRAIKEMGERYGMEVRDLVVSMEAMTGGRLGSMIDRLGPDRLARQTGQLFEAGRLAGFGFVETGQFTAAVAANMIAEGMDPSGAIGVARRSLSDTAAAMQMGGGRQAGRQEHLQSALNRRRATLGSQTGRLIALTSYLEEVGLLEKGYTNIAFADGKRPNETEVMRDLEKRIGQSAALTYFDPTFMATLAGEYADKIEAIMIRDPKSPFGPVKGIETRLRESTGLGLTDEDIAKFREFSTEFAGVEARKRFEDYLKETGKDVAAFRGAWGQEMRQIMAGGNYASEADFWRDYQIALGGKSATQIEEAIAGREMINRVLFEGFSSSKDIKFKEGFLGFLEYLSSTVEAGEKLTITGIGEALVGANLEQIDKEVQRRKEYLKSEEGFESLVAGFIDRGKSPTDARAAARRVIDAQMSVLEEYQGLTKETREEIIRQKEIAEKERALKAEGEGVTQGFVSGLFEDLKKLLEDIQISISGNLTLSDDGAYIEGKANKAAAEAEAKKPGGIKNE